VPGSSSQRLYLRVGLLVVAGAALAIGFVLFLTAERLDQGAVVYESYFQESVQGLDVGSAVRYRGVSIGRVTEIGLVAATYRRPQGDAIPAAFRLVLVRFSVNERRIGDVPSLEVAVKLGLRVRIAAQGITGVNYLELDFVDPERFPVPDLPWKPDYPFVPAIPSTVAQVQTAAEALLQKLQGVDVAGLLDNVNGLITDLRGQTEKGDLASALQEATALLRSVRGEVERAEVPKTLADLRDAIGDLRTLLDAPELRQAVSDASGALAAVRGAATDAQALIGGRELRQLLTNAADAMAEVRTAAKRLPATLAALETTARTARSASTDVQADLAPILRDMRAAVSNLREATELLRRYPGQAIFGSPPPAPGGR
jgi:ABC-type transporter Mla subunit MlaD